MLPTLVPTADEGVLCVAFSEGEGRPRSKTNPTSALLGPVLKQASTPVLLEGRGRLTNVAPGGSDTIGLQDPGRVLRRPEWEGAHLYTLSLLCPENKGKEVTPGRSCGSVCLCLCACLSVRISLCVCVCVGLHVCLSSRARMCLRVCGGASVYLWVSVCACICMPVSVCLYIIGMTVYVVPVCLSVCVSACLRVYSGGEDCGRPETSGLSA